MKFPIFKKRQKRLYAVLAVIMFMLALLIGSILLIEDVYQDGPVIVVLVALLFVLCLTITTFVLVLGFSSVTLDKNGIMLYFGKIRLNKIGWASVKRVELVAFGATWMFNVMKKNKPSYSFRMGRMLENFNKKRITFLYNSDAQEIISQYYDGEIISPSPM